MSNDIDTHLQALFHSGQITGYIHSKLPDGSLKTGWIEIGLLSKGMKGELRDKNNQESLAIPADRFTRLTRDRGGWKEAAIVIIGPKGLTKSKFVAIVFGRKDSQSLIAFQIQNNSPHEIIRLLLHNVLGKKVSESFEEPPLDYLEHLKMDISDDEVYETTVLSLPKKQVKMSEWIKDALLSPSSPSIQIQHGKSNQIPRFAALVSRWLTGLELFKSIPSGIATLVFINQKSMDTCFWDQPQRIAAFITFNHDNLELLSRKYLIPLWFIPGDRVETPQPPRVVTVESRRVSTLEKQPSPRKTVAISTKDTDTMLVNLTRRLETLESLLKSDRIDADGIGKNRGTMDMLQARLSENIKRIESLLERLNDLEKRIKKIRT